MFFNSGRIRVLDVCNLSNYSFSDGLLYYFLSFDIANQTSVNNCIHFAFL